MRLDLGLSRAPGYSPQLRDGHLSSSQSPKRPVPNGPPARRHVIAGKYKILKKIGEGGMGSVYIANQDPIDRKVAVKVLLGKLAEDEIAVKRFEQEAKAISRMQHPNTVTIYDFGKTGEETGERLYIVMEYLRGRTLTQVLRADGQLEPHRAARIMRQVCASLADAHTAGIIHRDLKPDNIFLTEVGGDKDWVKVLDFGVAKLADSEGAGTLTQTGMIFGTPKYMSPEQAEGRPIDYRADIYALGVVLYELLVGRPPFVADTPVGLLLKHISEPPPAFGQIRPDLAIDPQIEAITMKALEKRPEARHQIVSELAAELESFERVVSGSIPVPGLNTLATGPSGLPTEVNAGQQAQMTPRDLAPPGQVPSGLSLGELEEPDPRVLTGVAGPGTGNTADAGQAYAYAQTADVGVQGGESRLMTTPGITHPTPAQGGGIETLGGIGGEFSGSRPVPGTRSSATTVAGVVLLLAAMALGAYAVMDPATQAKVMQLLPGGGKEIPVATKLDAPPIEPAPPPAAPIEEGTNDGASSPQEAPPPPPAAERPAVAPPPAAPPPRSAEVEPPAPPAAPSPLVSVKFDSTPPGAKVVLVPSGKQLGFTPFSTELPRNDLITVAFTLDGFARSERTFGTDDDRTIRAELAKAKKPAAAKACADGSPPPCKKKPPVRKPPKRDDKVLDLKVDDLKGF